MEFEFTLDYENILFLRRSDDCFYVRYKNSKTEFCIPFNSLFSFDRDREFYDYCKELEKYHDVTETDKTNYWKYISDDDRVNHKTYFTKYDIVYSNGTILIYKTPIKNRWVIWNKAKGKFETSSTVVLSKNIPVHIPAIMSVKRIPDQPNKSILGTLMILTDSETYKKRLNDMYIKLEKKEM
jgi:hypothetical protein